MTRLATSGGIGSSLGGDKFANGAQTGAFSYLFGEAVSRQRAVAPEPQFSGTFTGEETQVAINVGPGCSDLGVGLGCGGGAGGLIGGARASGTMGANARAAGSRVNTDLPGGRAAAKSIFRNRTKGLSVDQTQMQNGGTRRFVPDGTQIRFNPNGTTRIDLPSKETIHFE